MIRFVIGLSFIFYLCVIILLLFIEARGYMTASGMSFLEYAANSSNIIPFKTIGTYIQAMFTGSMNIDIPVKNLIGNVLVLLPLGLYLPFFIKSLRKIGAFTITLTAVSFLIEILQLVMRRGTFDIDDVILYMLGAWLGFALWKTNPVKMIVRYLEKK
ncbi:VanZ family protein [Salibacterium lacus]|uniref:VanZ family protein n=1 Tax=Salibacterium lacus TaxID=1898109 RepID=A0ABW5T3R4_9BACI